MDSPITMAELHKAIQHMSINKALGPDGFPAEFYKVLWTVIALTFYIMVLDIKKSGILMTSANICLLLKPASY